MRQAILVLAKNHTEAYQYAKTWGWHRSEYRAVSHHSQIAATRNADVHILPSFLKRIDRHAIIAELRWARTLTVYYVDPADLVEPVEMFQISDEVQAAMDTIFTDLGAQASWENDGGAVSNALETLKASKAAMESVDGLEPVGWVPPAALTSEQILRLAAGESGADAAPMEGRDEPTGEAEQGEGPQEAEPADAAKRRRSRCKECGVLHFKGDPCEGDS